VPHKYFCSSVETVRECTPEPCQIVDIKQSPIIDSLCRHPPESEAIGLRIQQFIKPIKTARIADVAVNSFNSFFDRALYLRGFGATPFQTFLDDLLFTGALLDSLGVGLGPPRQIFERGENALKFRIKIFLAKLRQIFQRQFQNGAVGARGDWENMIEISE